jgi:glycosyltransferase 2 family protein
VTSYPPVPPAPGTSGFQKLFRTALIVIPIGVLGNVIVSFMATDRTVLATLHELPRGYLLLAVLLGLVPWVTNTLRMMLWTDLLGHRIRFRDGLQITLAVDLGAAISPTAVGGGFLKWAMLVQRGIKPGAAVSVTTLPSIEDGVFFAIALPLAIVWTSAWDLPVFRMIGAQLQTHSAPVVFLAALILLLLWVAARLALGGVAGSRVRRRGLSLTARIRRRLREAWLDARGVYLLILQQGKWRFAVSLSLTAVQWGARYSVISALIAFLGAPVQPVLFWLFQWVVFTLMTFVPTPGALGGAEAAFFLIYSGFLPAEIIGLATAGWRFLTFYFQLAVAAVLFTLLQWRARA